MTQDEIQKAVFAAVRAIPRGKVASYGEVALRAGLPRRARLVGRLLREAPAGADLPWHRVVRSDGRLAFPEGSAPYMEQRARLEMEGVAMTGGRVARGFFAWKGEDMDAELWKFP